MARPDTEQWKSLALNLLRADSERDVIALLKDSGFWDSPNCWRLLGDEENNFATVGAQQARPESALVEKIVNSVDARLTAACLRAGIDPAGIDAPPTIKDAVERFFSDGGTTKQAKNITVALTGARAHDSDMPSITVCDTGEGQTPSAVPHTFMSINKKNKLRIPFVQGKFNMGGTGALMFCGKQKLQLLITRRDPCLVDDSEKDGESGLWSVTVVRRETPPDGPGQVRHPVFKYLAPVGVNESPTSGQVLTFRADALPLMPESNRPYERAVEWGSCVKLYNYEMRGFKGHSLRKGGLLSRMEILLPEIALPVRMHECRAGFKGHGGSHDTNLVGLRERIDDGRNLEPGFPLHIPLSIQGEPFHARIYAFQGDSAGNYRADQGVVFTINGQTHGSFPKSFFERRRVKMSRLANALLIVVDASGISVDARADLFKNSRDRLSAGDLRRDLEEELEVQIANNQALKELRERRRREEVSDKLKDSKPLEDALRDIIKSSPNLSKLLMLGQRVSTPFQTSDQGSAGGGKGSKDGKAHYIGRAHPTIFHFQKLNPGDVLGCQRQHGHRARFRFATDVTNDYFGRDNQPGRYSVEVVGGSLSGRMLTTVPNLYNGIATWTVSIPWEDTKVGDNLRLKFTVEDDVILAPFINYATVELLNDEDNGSGKNGKRDERSGGDNDDPSGSGNKRGNKSKNGKDGEPMGLIPPEIERVRRAGWHQRGFDQYSACTVIEDDASDGSNESTYTVYVNVDNSYLLGEIKDSRLDPTLLEAKFVFGNVLLALALIHAEKDEAKPTPSEEENEIEIPVRKKVEDCSRALAPFLLPMVEYLGGLSDEEGLQFAQAGDED